MEAMTIVQRVFMGIGMLFVGLVVLGGVLGTATPQSADAPKDPHAERVHVLNRELKSAAYQGYVAHDRAWDTAATLIIVDYGDDTVSSEEWVATTRRRLATLRRESRALRDSVADLTDAELRAVLSRAAEIRGATTRAITALRATVMNGGDQNGAFARVTKSIDATDAAFGDFVDVIRPYVPAKQVNDFVRRRDAQGNDLLKRIAGDSAQGTVDPAPSTIDPTPTKLDGTPSYEFEQDDLDAAASASDGVKDYCAGAVSEAQRLGCESHVTDDELP